ncbi:MAG: AMP-dependent synthetase/ligase [Candidatus Promineifilaceae bacterium]
MTTDSILHRLQRNAETMPNAPAYNEKVNGNWKATNWKDYHQQVRWASRAMIALGITTGDIVTILGFNRPEWVIADLAAMQVGGAAAGIYTSNSPQEVAYIVGHANSKLIIAEDRSQYDKLVATREDLPALEHIVMMRGADFPADDDMVMSWEAFMSKGDSIDESEVDARMAQLTADQLATLIYTSGTTGPPKGVMLTHDNLSWTSSQAGPIVGMGRGDSNLSYLPLSHIAEQMFTIHSPITFGSTVYFAEDVLKILDNLKEVQPTIIFGVPRVWERFYNGVNTQLSSAEGIKAKIASWARGVGTQVSDLRNVGKEPSGLLSIQYAIAKKLVFDKLHAALGLSRAKAMVSGAAPIPKQILDFFASLDLPILEVYGQSEGSGPTSFNLPGQTRFGSVGPAYPGVEVKVLDDGEIVFKGRNIFAGYLHNEAATNSTLIDGWLHSGDLGKFDDEGFLYITGRKKDIIITSGGKNIAPKNLEAAMTTIPLVSSAVCVGERQRYLIGLMTLVPETAEAFAKEHGIAMADLPTHPKLRETLDAAIKKNVNAHFAKVEHIRNYVILPQDFSVETGELTPTFKIKRAVVNKMYANEIDACYADGQLKHLSV